ncbi:MAG: tyrosine-type recombinase/integrase [Solirubrobacteraceae bacterium]
MSIHRKGTKWSVRYRDAGRNRSRTFDRKRDAEHFDAEVTRRRQLGGLAALDAGRQTLDEFVTAVWAPTYAVTLAAKTRQHYANLYDHHISPDLGHIALRELRPERIARWQADRLAAGAGPVCGASRARHARQRAATRFRGRAHRRQPRSSCTTRARRPRREEVRPLAPVTIERMRAAASLRDATVISVLAYAGLRPSEALALTWRDVREKTLLVQRALSLEEADDTKTRHHRTVRLLAPLHDDLARWRGDAPDRSLVFPGHDGEPWSLPAY